MLSHLKKYEILLASNSPRRRELLAGLDIDYRVTALPEVDGSSADSLWGGGDTGYKTHTVITGVTLTSLQKQISFTVSTEVTFAALGDDEIDYYVEKYRPLDKAGAYGVQEWIVYIGVTGLKGSYYNVMGLPLQLLHTELKKF